MFHAGIWNKAEHCQYQCTVNEQHPKGNKYTSLFQSLEILTFIPNNICYTFFLCPSSWTKKILFIRNCGVLKACLTCGQI